MIAAKSVKETALFIPTTSFPVSNIKIVVIKKNIICWNVSLCI